jgi:hypothetical protein
MVYYGFQIKIDASISQTQACFAGQADMRRNAVLNRT